MPKLSRARAIALATITGCEIVAKPDGARLSAGHHARWQEDRCRLTEEGRQTRGYGAHYKGSHAEEYQACAWIEKAQRKDREIVQKVDHSATARGGHVA